MTGSGNSIFKIINVKRKIFLYTMMICACSFLAPVVAQAQPKAEIRYPGSSKIDLAGPAALAVMKGGRSRVIVQFRLTESQSAAISAMAKANKSLSIAQAPGVLYVRANGDAWLESAGKTLPVRFRAANDSAAPGSFTMLTGKGALPGHFIPDYALTIGSEQPESRLRIRGVHDMRKVPEDMAH